MATSLNAGHTAGDPHMLRGDVSAYLRAASLPVFSDSMDFELFVVNEPAAKLLAMLDAKSLLTDLRESSSFCL